MPASTLFLPCRWLATHVPSFLKVGLLGHPAVAALGLEGCQLEQHRIPPRLISTHPSLNGGRAPLELELIQLVSPLSGYSWLRLNLLAKVELLLACQNFLVEIKIKYLAKVGTQWNHQNQATNKKHAYAIPLWSLAHAAGAQPHVSPVRSEDPEARMASWPLTIYQLL